MLETVEYTITMNRSGAEVNCTLHFSFSEAEAQTYDYPGCPAEVEVYAVSVDGVDIPEEVIVESFDDLSQFLLENRDMFTED